MDKGDPREKNHMEKKKKIHRNQQNTQNTIEAKVKDCVLRRNEGNVDQFVIKKTLKIKRKKKESK